MKRAINLVVMSLFLFGKGFGFFCTPCACDWTGFYIGANLGGALNNFAISPFHPTVSSGSTLQIKDSYFLGGGQIGYNYQFCDLPIVCGLEASFDWVNKGEKSRALRTKSFGVYEVALGVNLEYFGTLNAKIGFTAAGTYLYLLGGGAYEKMKASWQYNSFSPLSAASFPHLGKNLWGWTFGGGIEKCLTPRLSLRAQVASLGFKTYKQTKNIQFNGPKKVIYQMEPSTLVGLIGINYRFCCR